MRRGEHAGGGSPERRANRVWVAAKGINDITVTQDQMI
jgi:hypothetical protein